MKKFFDCDEFMRSVRREARDRKYLKERDRDWRRLFNSEGEEFLRCAYGFFLHREIDDLGLNTYLPILEKKMGKAHIICALLFSTERTDKNPFFKCVSRFVKAGYQLFFKRGKGK